MRNPTKLRYAGDGRGELLDNRMATHEQVILPAGLERRSRPWLSSARTRDDWGNARSMRRFVERVREAQAKWLASSPVPI
jgi:hypothetical protein